MHTKLYPVGDLWTHLTSNVPPIPGRIRQEAADFRVDEVPAYPPSGTGTHLFVHFEKVGLTTAEAVRRLAVALGVPPKAGSWAGLKDRRAVTTQWASFEGARAEAAQGVELDGVRVLAAAPNEHKLRTGHLRANHFRIVVRDVPAERLGDLETARTHLSREGVPNYYEAQRFGRDGGNLKRALRWLVEGGRPPRDRAKRKWDVSVVQSWLFNRVLAERITDGLLGRAVAGDLMRKEETGGLFVCDDVVTDQARVERWEISPTGPMFGPKMRHPAAEAHEREQTALTRSGLTEDTIRGFGRMGQGTRRALRVPLAECDVEPTAEGVALTFTLPTGAYATAVLGELFKEGLTRDPPPQETPGGGNRAGQPGVGPADDLDPSA
ncbi:MAG: tRNA pseudouridine(13) synthase TruD [Myxococcota bacterium]